MVAAPSEGENAATRLVSDSDVSVTREPSRCSWATNIAGDLGSAAQDQGAAGMLLDDLRQSTRRARAEPRASNRATSSRSSAVNGIADALLKKVERHIADKIPSLA